MGEESEKTSHGASRRLSHGGGGSGHTSSSSHAELTRPRRAARNGAGGSALSKRIGRLSLLAAAAGLGALVIRGFAEPYWLEVARLPAEVPHLPQRWRGKRLALLCDFHIGIAGSENAARRGISGVLQERPDVVLLAGDFVHGEASAIPRTVRLLQPIIDQGIPCYAVLGNHDYDMPMKDGDPDWELARRLVRALTEAGVRVLNNEAVVLDDGEGDREVSAEPAERLHLVGVGAYAPDEDRAHDALADLPEGAPRLVLMHHPASFDKLPPGTAPVSFAGHTHGGQIRLPLAPLMRYLTYVKQAQVAVAGWIEVGRVDGYGSSGNRLFISRGVGCSIAPFRLFCRPEVTLFTLVPA